MTVLPLETLVPAGYACLLAAIAAGLEWTARRVYQRSEEHKTAGFFYKKELDVWQCPAGEHLHPHAADTQRTRILYRAPPHTCNRCSRKHQCTDSDQGRILEIRPDAWVDSTMARFHRGLSLALLLLAEMILGLALVRASLGAAAGTPQEAAAAAWLLASLLVAGGVVTIRLAQRFFQSRP